jgi:hypothetical protein
MPPRKDQKQGIPKVFFGNVKLLAIIPPTISDEVVCKPNKNAFNI